MPIQPHSPSPHHYASAKMLQLLSTFGSNADITARQAALDFLVEMHSISLANTRSLRYDSGLVEKDGRNVKGAIRIGPPAFSQDSAWLANVVFHETVHSDQFVFYDQEGAGSINPKNSEPERILVALDEYEAFYWSWYYRQALGLDPRQSQSLERELALWTFELDDKPTVELAKKAKFDDARTKLISRIPATSTTKKPTATKTSQLSRRTCCSLA